MAAKSGVQGMQFQSTHLCKVRLIGGIVEKVPEKVSIHAPVQGATYDSDRSYSRLIGFNPRTCARCDLSFQDFPRLPPVSIHAPVQGATIVLLMGQTHQTGFNPRTCARCDANYHKNKYKHWAFQSTHLCKVRRSRIACKGGPILFQSTHLCKVRQAMAWFMKRTILFQSTHLCKVRRKHGYTSKQKAEVSIHAPVQGATAQPSNL